ncbi:hypothetical protein NDU88_003736 [Pleurodeles waltl]|uniref:Uncharacterized protein n=1 Tax=Pleurodeles waltl TaxID=8319 RepID=A0AAV7TPW4_PLEWA|nr:hypothetical protein NDU88_003736 [Pleurodeles waltl]
MSHRLPELRSVKAASTSPKGGTVRTTSRRRYWRLRMPSLRPAKLSQDENQCFTVQLHTASLAYCCSREVWELRATMEILTLAWEPCATPYNTLIVGELPSERALIGE